MILTDSIENVRRSIQPLSLSKLGIIAASVNAAASGLNARDYVASRAAEYHRIIAMFPNAQDYAHKLASEVSTKPEWYALLYGAFAFAGLALASMNKR